MKNLKVLVIAATVLITFLTSGCSRKIEGEAFLKDNNNNSVTKLADIEVRLIELSKFHDHIKIRQKDSQSEISRLESNIATTEASTKSMVDAQMAIFNIMAKGVSFNINSLGGQYYQQQQDTNMNAASKAIQENKERVSKYNAEIETIKNGRNGKFFYPADKTKDLISTKTQSDGKYELNIKSDSELVLLANSGEKYWIIKLNKDDKKISLTDSNENGKNCEICAIKN
jgi:hypothetical protein